MVKVCAPDTRGVAKKGGEHNRIPSSLSKQIKNTLKCRKYQQGASSEAAQKIIDL
jgi:hypothetical protein